MVLADAAARFRFCRNRYVRASALGSLVPVGDVDQFPSVGPRMVVGHLIDSGVAPVRRMGHLNGVPKSIYLDDRKEKEPPGETNNPLAARRIFPTDLFVQVRQSG